MACSPHAEIMCQLKFSLPCKLGWPYMPFFLDASWPGFMYCLKYLDLGLFACADWSVYYIIIPYRRFLMVSKALGLLWCQTLISLSRAALSQTHLICTRNCIALTVDLTFSQTMIAPLCTMPACYWSNYFSFITFSKHENRKTKPKQILAKTCPGKMSRMVTLV